jgi:hypothetical protein
MEGRIWKIQAVNSGEEIITIGSNELIVPLAFIP